MASRNAAVALSTLAFALAPAAVASAADAGDLDPTFGTGGVVTTPAGDAHSYVRALTVTPSGAIVAAGAGLFNPEPWEDWYPVVARYTATGALDPSFNGGAPTAIPNPMSGDNTTMLPATVDVGADDTILTGGRAANASQRSGFVSRLTAAGAIDSGFATAGVRIDGFRDVGVVDLARLGDGRIVAAGSSYGIGNTVWEARRLTSAGQPDTTFDTDGARTLPWFVNGWQDYARAVFPQAGGKLVLVGDAELTHDNAAPAAFALTRLNADGSTDTSFGSAGKVLIEHPDLAILTASAATATADGGFLIAGYGLPADPTPGDGTPGGPPQAVLAHVDGNGALDPDFGTDGFVTADLTSGTTTFSDVEVDGEGRIVLQASVGGQQAVLRLLADGTVDTSFGTDGAATSPLTERLGDLAIAPNDDVLLGGSTLVAGEETFAVARLVGDAREPEAPQEPETPQEPGTPQEPTTPEQPTPQAPTPPAAPAPESGTSASSSSTTPPSVSETLTRLGAKAKLLSTKPKGGVVRVRVSYPRGTRGTAVLRLRDGNGRGTLVASKRFSIRSGTSRTISVPFTKAGRKLVARRSVKLFAVITVTP